MTSSLGVDVLKVLCRLSCLLSAADAVIPEGLCYFSEFTCSQVGVGRSIIGQSSPVHKWGLAFFLRVMWSAYTHDDAASPDAALSHRFLLFFLPALCDSVGLIASLDT